MTLTQLSYIVAVDKYRHFATAAQHIYITQPTLSMQIQKLEEELGVILFDRSKTPVVPTEKGIRIIEEAKAILSGARHIEDLASHTEKGLRGSFKIGIIPTVAPYLVPLFLKPFMDRHPEVELVFHEALTADILSALNEDELDIGIIGSSSGQQFFEQTLFLEPFQAYVSVSHPLAVKEKLRIDDLYAEELWLLNEGHCFRDQALKLCKKDTQRFKSNSIQFESGNLETLKKLVEQDFGMTLLPYLSLQSYHPQCANGVIKTFEEPVPRRKIRLIHARAYLKEHHIRALYECIQECLPEELKGIEEENLVH